MTHDPLANFCAPTAIVCQIVGGAFTNSAANSAFVNQIVQTAATNVPDMPALTLISTGATELRTVFSAAQLPGVLIAWVAGLRLVWAIAAGMAGLSFLVTGLSSWKRVHGATPGVVGA